MSFEKYEWQKGETITAEKLNRMEDGIEEAMQSGGGDCGFECTESWVTLTEENVTTEAQQTWASGLFAYNNPIDAETIRVTFNGIVYECERMDAGITWAYGGIGPSGPDFSEYPFAIESVKQGDSVNLYTETAGTYSVKIEAGEEVIETTPCFEKAVKSIGGLGVLERLTLENSDDRYYLKLSNGEYLSESNFDSNKVYIYNDSLNLLYYEAVSSDLNGDLVFVYATINPTGATLKKSTFTIGEDGRYFIADNIS